MASADYELNATNVVLALPTPKLDRRRKRVKANADAASEGAEGSAASMDAAESDRQGRLPTSPVTSEYGEERGEAETEHRTEPSAPSRTVDAHNDATASVTFSRLQLAATHSSERGNAAAEYRADCEAFSTGKPDVFDFLLSPQDTVPRAITSIEERRTLEVSVVSTQMNT